MPLVVPLVEFFPTYRYSFSDTFSTIYDEEEAEGKRRKIMENTSEPGSSHSVPSGNHGDEESTFLKKCAVLFYLFVYFIVVQKYMQCAYIMLPYMERKDLSKPLQMLLGTSDLNSYNATWSYYFRTSERGCGLNFHFPQFYSVIFYLLSLSSRPPPSSPSLFYCFLGFRKTVAEKSGCNLQ